MFRHHEETIQKVKDHFEKDPSVLALLLCGSIAHGFESAESDVDVAIVIGEDDFGERRRTGARPNAWSGSGRSWTRGSGTAARRAGRENAYRLGLAARKLVLFGGRLILAHNDVLYPYHKWFLRVLDGPAVADKPGGLVPCALRLMADPAEENVREFFDLVKAFQPWPQSPNGWGAQFMVDSELSWMSGHTPVDDL